VTLSASGSTFSSEAQRLIGQFESCERLTRMAAEGTAGRLVIGYIDFAFGGSLPALLQRFRQANPTIDIELVRMATDHQKVALASGQGIDIGYVLGRFTAPDIECSLAERQKNIALLPSQHPLAKRSTIQLSDLLREPLVIGTAHDWSAFRRIIIDNALRIGIRPHIVQEAPSAEFIFALVSAGIGVSIYGISQTELVRNGVTVRALAGMKGDMNIYAAWNARRLTPVAQRFVQEVIKRH
jgi:DNA-binding transcriptional LysR family regulator